MRGSIQKVGVPSLIVMPAQEIQQSDLDRMVMLRNQLMSIQMELQEMGAAAVAQLERNAKVEAGTHKVWIEEKRKGSHIFQALILNGSELGD